MVDVSSAICQFVSFELTALPAVYLIVYRSKRVKSDNLHHGILRICWSVMYSHYSLLSIFRRVHLKELEILTIPKPHLFTILLFPILTEIKCLSRNIGKKCLGCKGSSYTLFIHVLLDFLDRDHVCIIVNVASKCGYTHGTSLDYITLFFLN